MKRILIAITILLCAAVIPSTKVAYADNCAFTASYDDTNVYITVNDSSFNPETYPITIYQGTSGTGPSYQVDYKLTPTELDDGGQVYSVSRTNIVYNGGPGDEILPFDPSNTSITIDPGSGSLCSAVTPVKYEGGDVGALPTTPADPADQCQQLVTSVDRPNDLSACTANPALYSQCINNVSSSHQAECYGNPTTYFASSTHHSCFDEGTDYANNCSNDDAQTECSNKTQADGTKAGAVYVRVLGTGQHGSCLTFIGLTKSIVNYALFISSLVAAFMLLKGGFKYTTSRGDAAGLMEARDQIMHATIGVILLACAYIIILFLQGSFSFLGLNLVGPF